MAKEESFTAEARATLREAPLLSAMAVTMAGASGKFGNVQEASSLTPSLVEGAKGNNETIRGPCAREEISAAHGGELRGP